MCVEKKMGGFPDSLKLLVYMHLTAVTSHIFLMHACNVCAHIWSYDWEFYLWVIMSR